MRALPLFAALAALAGFASSAAAHDAPLAFVEAMETHLLDCPAGNGYQPGGDLLSDEWVLAESFDPVLTAKTEKFLGHSRAIRTSLNVFTKTAQTLDMTQLMAMRTLAKEGTDPGSIDLEDAEASLDAIEATELLCVTMVPDLPFMPSGKLLEAVFGREVEFGIANTPGDILDGNWLWDDLSPTHQRTIARYTNEYANSKDLPERTFYPGFYILSLHHFTAENSDTSTQSVPDTSTQESDQQ